MGRFSKVAGKARAYLVGFADRFLGCRHRKTTMPMTSRSGNSDLSGTYIVCLECGRRLPYDLNAMAVLNRRPFFFRKRKAPDPQSTADRPSRP